MQADQEDYRVKNAREGRAIYVPGKSAEEMKAIIAAEKAEADAKVPPLKLTAEEATTFADAIDTVCIRMSQAENVFALLARIQQDGEYEGHHGLADMAHLAAAALGALGNSELDTLNKLSNRIMTGS
ncbi:hypothetical protein [Pseudotabrizicola algicola]|uniref:Uncharacterized protein n=1 Tax=Pseudotabrizicola algicola TaxID=2709381 RepID=A0A6B3RNP7_9RHOB|nr:hypothetical protein [Pseudotabrizicola algicola]NEX47734.1 hypothetical protein [Pseudotabrizicola algicola]